MGYKASEGPWDREVMVEALALEYSGIQPSAHDQVEAFLNSPDQVRRVTFGDRGPNYPSSH
jgi:hypothetical protein